MRLIRRSLGGLLAILGTYYCVLSVLTLVRLPAVTASWIQRSGDPDFKYDYGTFMLWIAVGTVVLGVFGCRTAVKGVYTARGNHPSWFVLAIGAPVLHWFWFLYRSVGNGTLDRAAQADAQRNDGLLFGTICVAYLVMWIVMRQRDAATRPVNHSMPATTEGA